jgi:hypothetical protein
MELHSTIAEAVDGALDRTRRSRKRLKRNPTLEKMTAAAQLSREKESGHPKRTRTGENGQRRDRGRNGGHGARGGEIVRDGIVILPRKRVLEDEHAPT